MTSTAPCPYAHPRAVADITDCYFYHSMEIPGHGEVTGEWDLRGDEHRYLGGVDLAGRRVLELGSASGFLTTYMERQGAEVVAYDLSEDDPWDVVPFAGDETLDAESWRDHLRKINNGFWLNHQAHGLTARLAHGTVYTVTDELGKFDVATFAAILLHLRDPFRALQTSLRLVTDMVVVTDVYPASDYHLVADIVDAPDPSPGVLTPLPPEAHGEPKATFLPQYWDAAYGDTWWHMSPELVRRYVGVLGFPDTEITYHHALARGRRTLLYTVVGRRRGDATRG
jgi:SAM-dependent methyltransferase